MCLGDVDTFSEETASAGGHVVDVASGFVLDHAVHSGVEGEFFGAGGGVTLSDAVEDLLGDADGEDFDLHLA